jgi:hypothetical protein
MKSSKKKLHSIEYISKEGQEIIIDEKGHNKLSPISLSVLDSILGKQVTILFSQGPLNLTPIISCLFVFQKKQDVLVGIPKRLFNEVYEKYTKIYFSLLYKCKDSIRSIISNSKYFYYDMLWCKGKIDEDSNELTKLDIETYPRHGTPQFRRNYDLEVRGKLKKGIFQKIPKVVLVPIAGIPPSGIIGEKEIKFEDLGYKLNKFDPKLIIYESINERKHSFDALIKLIKEIENSERKLVLHFSWPYLKGLTNFLVKIQDDKNIAMFHLGKRFCIESQKENHFEKPPSNILPLSIEGDLWDTVYYPENNFLSFKIILPAQMNSKNISLSDIVSYDWLFDARIEDIREYLKYEGIGRIEDNILKFPPVIDTFLCPSEIKRRSLLQKENDWKTLPLKESVSIKASENSHAIRAFSGLCSDLEKYRDLSYELSDLFTNQTVTKKTLFQAYIIEKILNKFADDSHSDSIIVANLHPYLITDLSWDESLNYLFNSIVNWITDLKLPKILKDGNVIYCERELSNGERLKEIIWDGVLHENKIRYIKRLFPENITEVDICDSKEGKNLRIIVKINVPIRYIDLDIYNSIINKKYFINFIIYKAIIRDDGSFNEYKISNISFKIKPKNSIVSVELEFRNDKTNKKSVEKEIQIKYLELSKIQTLPQELITNSELLIPGPIPFHTVSGEDILISQGYDALLLPFKKIIFFAYPGANFKQLLKQIRLYKDLVSGSQTRVSQRDLIFSVNYTKNTRRFKLPPTPSSDSTTESAELDTPIDTMFREAVLDESNADKEELAEIKTLKDIWNSIRKKPSSYTPTYHSTFSCSREKVDICIEFETGTKETLSFPVGTLIRKKHGNEYIFSSVEELSEGEQIIYIQTDERDSIENYLLKTIFNEDEMTLEDILEPLRALKLFYDSLKSLDFINGYSEIKLKELYWLSSNQKKNLFDLIRGLLNQDTYDLEEVSNLLNNSIWRGLVTPERLIEIFKRGRKTLTYEKLYSLSKELGLKNYKRASFKVLCSTAINEQKHYSFHDEKNLLVLGKLIGHQGIIDNYHVINEKGGKIRTFLQQVGHSIKRVANGNGDPLNEMDVAIEGKMRKGKVVKMGNC